MYTNVVFETDKRVLFIEVFLIQGCPYRDVPLYIPYCHDCDMSIFVFSVGIHG